MIVATCDSLMTSATGKSQLSHVTSWSRSNKMAKFDIVVPCYNYARFLPESVDSVLNQSIRDVSVVIIDDASTDDTPQVAERLSRSDKRVTTIIHPNNWGHIKTYNQGISWASGQYFLLLSADDLLAPGALQRASEVMDANNDIVITHGIGLSWQDNSPPPIITPSPSYEWARQDLIREMCTGGVNLVNTPTAIVRTATQKNIGEYRESLPHSGDMEMWLRLASCGAVARIEAIQAIYRQHSENMSRAYYAQAYADLFHRRAAFDSFFKEPKVRSSDVNNLKMHAHRALAEDAMKIMMRQLAKGRLRDCFDLVRFVQSMYPKLSTELSRLLLATIARQVIRKVHFLKGQ